MCILIGVTELIIRVSCHLRVMGLQGLDATAAAMLMKRVMFHPSASGQRYCLLRLLCC